MCQITENSETIKCDCKQLCCKMQNESLRLAISGLKSYQHSTPAILKTLDAIHNVLEVYSCLPGTCLLKRVEWVHNNIIGGTGALHPCERTAVNMLISELETFLKNS